MTTTSPIDLALKAVSTLFSDSPPELAAYTDDSSTKLETLVGELTKTGNPYPVLIRMGTKESKKRQPYADLLQQTIEERQRASHFLLFLQKIILAQAKSRSVTIEIILFVGILKSGMLPGRHLGVSGSIHSIVADLVKFKPASKTKTEKLPNFTKFKNLKAGDIEIYVGINSDKTPATKSRQTANQSLLNWAQLESCLEEEAPTTSFSRLAGGIRPLVYVFDDYNNFIVNSQEEFYQLQTPKVITKKISEFYGRSSSSNAPDLESAIRGFGRCLNTLSLVFNVKAPDIKFDGDRKNRYEIVAEKLNFQRLDRERNQIAAFVIDLEWLPDPKWIQDHPDDPNWGKRQSEEMGHIAIRLLTQHYPEIPCFVFTGLWSIEILQKSLAAGAAWCFQKPSSHHSGNTNHPEEELNYFNLERHLTEFAKRNYGADRDLPNPQQFNTRSNLPALSSLEEKLDIKFEDRTSDRFKQLIAHMFTTDRVDVVNVLGAGKSGAATFFVSPTSKDYKEATRFVKMDDWLKIQKEYASYQQIIRPKLNNHIARIIQKPSVSLQANDSANHFPSAGIVSSLAGFPENYEKLDSLEGIIRKHIDEKNGATEIIKRINSTLEFVLLPLHQPLKTKKYNLLAEFSCIYTGTLVNLLPAVANGEDVDIIDGDCERISLGEYAGRIITLKNWTFNRIDGNVVTITHPKTQATIKLRSQSVPDITKRFNTLWLKSGMLVNVDAIVDTENQDIRERFYNPKSWKICSQPGDFPAKLVELIKCWNQVNEQQLNSEQNIFYYFQGDNAFSIDPQNGKFGVIHGDLNLNNILYAENEIIGFLIDFANAKSEGLVAFDLAWLETQIWNNFLFPNIVELARRSPSGRTEHAKEICFLLNLAIESINNTNYPDRLFSAQISGTRTDDPLMICILNTLKVTSSARKLMTKKLGIPFKHGDINYALAVSFLRHTRFNIGADTAQSSEWIGNQSFLCANYYLNKYISDIELAKARLIE